VSYQVAVQTPQRSVTSMDELQHTPIAVPGRQSPQLLANLAGFHRTTTPLSLSTYNVQPVFDVYAAAQGTDLGSVSKRVHHIVWRAGGRRVRRFQSVPRIAKIAQRLGSVIPTSELKAIPKDLSSQIDHYVYGTPKK